MASDLVYVYAVAEAPVPDLDGLTGIAGRPVHAITGDGAHWAAAGQVPGDEFGESALVSNLEDLTWLARTAREHHGVVDELGHRSVLVPLALATVYHHEDGVRAMLTDRADSFTGLFDRLRGRAEWGVKAFAGAPQPQARADRPSSGADYLRRRRAALSNAARDDDAASAAAEELHRVACDLAVAGRRHRLHAAELTGRPGTMVLNGAYLVEEADRDGWCAAIDAAITGSTLTVEVTGPWVPYSFAGDER
ncbi:GvpL/GvpF family gas vesicle protein [Pseudonocardia sp. NPDC049635]|uniref:GvpL/GvpF family gas vesicle protein n=1 Tax=Pseudonocardia sp. NPDC049635 TaxID=3155506 RepID=UPI0033D2A495